MKAMDREQEDLQFLGFFDILKETIKIIFTWPKIFIKITLALVLPLSCIFLSNIGISMILSSKILHNMSALGSTQAGSPTYNNVSSIISSEWMIYWLIKGVYIILSLIFSLLSTSAVVYTIACVYTGKEITFRKVMSVVPKVWKRLMITFLCNFCVVFAYTFAFIFVIFIWAVIFALTYKPGGGQVGIAILAIILILFFGGLVYMSIIWQLANVISVLEYNCGFQAMRKSKALIKGKMGVGVAMFLVLGLCSLPIDALFRHFVAIDRSVGVGGRICYGILSLGLLTFLFLFILVAHTILYFVCKSYHHENIDKSALADHLEVYNNGDYVPLKAKDLQLGDLDV